jgi:hypothetical protein
MGTRGFFSVLNAECAENYKPERDNQATNVKKRRERRTSRRPKQIAHTP